MSTAERDLLKTEAAREREALRRRITIPPPEEVFYTLPAGDPEKAVALLESWCNVDEEEAQDQRETFEYLKRVLDEDRLSYRKLFP
jgi:hypothetical protein